MACPNQGVLNNAISFTIRTLDSGDDPTWADASPTYSVYEETTLIGNLVGTLQDIEMSKDDDTLGLYFSQIDLTASLFELYKTYIIVIDAIIDGSPVSRTYTFIAVGTFDTPGGGENQDNVNAVADYKGTFKQGDPVSLYLKITNFDGTPIDPYRITCTISGPTEDDSAYHIASSGVPFQADRGFYIYTWIIDADEDLGTYVIDWEYVVDEIERHEYQNVMVTSADSMTPYFYTQTWIAYRAALEHHICCAQSIPVYYEQARPTYDNKVFQFSFKNWNQTPGARVYRNEVLISDGIEVDYFNGKVTFANALMPQEQINIDYNFKWFDDDALNRFLLNALQTVNTFAPHSSYSLESLPSRFSPAVLYGAAKDALRQLMMCLNFQQPAQVFGGTEEAKSAFSNFETLKQNYNSDWEKLLEQKKLGPYPTTHMVVTPEYTLPGGRCFDKDTTVLVVVNKEVIEPCHYGKNNRVYTNNYGKNNRVYTNHYSKNGKVCSNVCVCDNLLLNDVEVQTFTMREVHKLFREGYNIELLSHNDYSGNLIFVPINYVWESGIKDAYELKTNNGYSVRTSDEHLYFVNGGYVPLRDIKIGDEITTSDNHTIETSTVKSINNLRRKVEMYDVEIFGTENLFANGIKCHNSRWFRYLFKGGG